VRRAIAVAARAHGVAVGVEIEAGYEAAAMGLDRGDDVRVRHGLTPQFASASSRYAASVLAYVVTQSSGVLSRLEQSVTHSTIGLGRRASSSGVTHFCCTWTTGSTGGGDFLQQPGESAIHRTNSSRSGAGKGGIEGIGSLLLGVSRLRHGFEVRGLLSQSLVGDVCARSRLACVALGEQRPERQRQH
jgi:hypothetical protein